MISDFTNNRDVRPSGGYSTNNVGNISSLTAPWDNAQRVNPLNVNHPSLPDEEFIKAYSDLYITKFTDNYKMIERRYADPQIPLQKFVLVSFIPTRGARPDQKGVYGMIKIRGSYDTKKEADERSADLIKNHDSYHKIYTAYVGRPFPITLESAFSQDISEIELHKNISEEISADVKKKRDAERKEIDTIQQRAKNIQDETDRESSDPLERYTTIKQKKAQLVWGYLNAKKTIADYQKNIINVFKDIKNMDEEYPEYKTLFYDKFINARRRVGIKDEKLEGTFMEYLVEDRLNELDFEIPKEYLPSPLSNEILQIYKEEEKTIDLDANRKKYLREDM